MAIVRAVAPKLVLVASAVTCALVCVGLAGASGARSSLVFSVAELRGAAAATHPGVLLPTRLPPRIAFADIGAFCNGPGLGGPPCFAMLSYTTRRTGCCEAFQLAAYNGRVAGKVLAALKRHDGKYGSTKAFSAGRFAGTRERQWNRTFKIGGVDTYVWQYGKFTYALAVLFRDSGALAFKGTKPLAIIASFSSVAGAKPPALPAGAPAKVMPHLVGLTLEAALAAAEKAGILPWLHTFDVPAPAPELVGRVVSTVPAAGVSFPAGSSVTVNVGKG